MDIKDFNELVNKKEHLEVLWKVKKSETEAMRAQIDLLNQTLINLAYFLEIPYDSNAQKFKKSIPGCILEYLEEKQVPCTLAQIREEVQKKSTTISSTHFISHVNAVLYTLKKEKKIISLARGIFKINSLAPKRTKNEHNTTKSIQ